MAEGTHLVIEFSHPAFGTIMVNEHGEDRPTPEERNRLMTSMDPLILAAVKGLGLDPIRDSISAVSLNIIAGETVQLNVVYNVKLDHLLKLAEGIMQGMPTKLETPDPPQEPSPVPEEVVQSVLDTLKSPPPFDPTSRLYPDD